MLIDVALTVGGLVLLALGADFLVRGAVGLARRLGISPLVIGLTVVAFGTSLPELLVSMRAAVGGATGLAVGNVVGSNIANVLLILGAAAAISPVGCNRTALLRDGSAMLVATALFILAGLLGSIDRAHGIVGLLLLGGYLYACYLMDRRANHALAAEGVQEVAPIDNSLAFILLAVLGGLLGVLGGAELLVDGATGLARRSGVSEEVIGLTLVAFGTSVPELATTVAAALRRHSDVALGNVLGSNLFNLLLIMGSVGLVVPFEIPAKIAAFDMWIMGAVSLALMPLMASGGRLSRMEGLALVALYLVFVATQFLGVGEMVMTML
ncbi:MAG: calcium/sodium antiporter [Rhodospirillaceae bacterium]|nr:calcium/sodium antiporter [Rhodospirillaceae bacterium]